MERLLRPYGVVIDGRLELGLELIILEGVIQEVRPHTGIPEPYVISPAFVNAHSHLEYRGLQGKLQAREYSAWIREITQAKQGQTLDQVREDCLLAARENRATGVAAIGEHSDRPFAAEALLAASLKGVIFQEVITRFEPAGRSGRLDAARRGAATQQSQNAAPVHLAPHAYQTADERTLREIATSGQPFSMHVAETDSENQLTLEGEGSIAETFRAFGVPYSPTGKRVIATLDGLGLLREGAQFVHCCAIHSDEVELLASRGVTIAHCPRSNENLRCPTAPVREMLDAGIEVGIGLDSAASSGPIDMFDEMRCAIRVSESRGRAVSAEEAWAMATSMGAKSLAPGFESGSWRIEPGSSVPLLKITAPGAFSTEAVIERASPDRVEWL